MIPPVPEHDPVFVTGTAGATEAAALLVDGATTGALVVVLTVVGGELTGPAPTALFDAGPHVPVNPAPNLPFTDDAPAA